MASCIILYLNTVNNLVTIFFPVAEKYMIPIIADEVYEYAVSISY